MTSRAFSEVSEDEGKDEDVMMCGPDDTTRLKKEVEDLKRQIHHTEKRTRKQDKELDKLRKELSNAHKMTSEQLSEIATLQSHSKKAEDLITTIEGHMNCHICMDILARPYGLSPCGHVDPIHSWANSQPIVQRKKICPVCRTHIRTRPIPLFVVKSVAAALEKHKAGTPGALPPRDSPPPEVDPWKGIFTKNAGMDNNDGDEDDGDDEDEEDQWSSDGEGYGGYGSEYDDDSDDEEYQGSWVHPHWEPPNGQLSPRDYAYLDDVEGEELSMLRRGCTLQMIHLFQLRYDHGEGLQALVDGDNTVHLGWNVSLLDHDASGEEFMDWITRDIHERPERWERVDHDDGTWSAWKLVRVERDQEYDDSDSDAWFDGLLSGDELDFL
ncbi:hypothetical protein EUX98_g4674 [Antrodiella citrinella]|uniref:DUF8191 domain-containing protein n=1 Tax=Antrodiella citrinella TaxID=2447956 RepID=A0A4S4MTE8_9APHY|nr:hypothetical protein EUX98_g4674 [Antrodiella citrinella]